jgi:hypothetical protein
VTPDPTRLAPDGRPTYGVAIKGADGVYYGVANDKGEPLHWAPAWDASVEKGRREAALRAKVDAARVIRDRILKGQLPPLPSATPGGRGPVPTVPLLGTGDAVP